MEPDDDTDRETGTSEELLRPEPAPPARRQRNTRVDVFVRVDVARIVFAIGVAVALIIAAAHQLPLPHFLP
jgi:hypothetical protein